jgi:hypothetical protein
VPGDGSCAAVGYYSTSSGMVPFSEVWNGRTWRLEATPHDGHSGRLSGVSCVSPRDCMAVGNYGADIWNGSSWRYQATATPVGAQLTTLQSVSCTSASACTAVGWYFSNTGAPLSLAEHWNGNRWAIQATPNVVPTGRNELNGVSCTSAASCNAVGTYTFSDFSPLESFAETWNGTSWQLCVTLMPPGTRESGLFGVSCVVAGCTAAGGITGISGIPVTLVMHKA